MVNPREIVGECRRIIIAFKGQFEIVYNSSLCRELSPTCKFKWSRRSHVQMTYNTSCAYHVQQVVLRAMWYEGTTKLLSSTEFKSLLFELYFIGWTINRWRRGGNQSTWRKPLATSFRKCHILKSEDSSPKWDSNPYNSIGGRLGKQTCWSITTIIWLYSHNQHMRGNTGKWIP